LSSDQIAALSAMDDPANMEILYRLGTALAERDVDPTHFLAGFDLPGG
jgi:hypothetical protein